VANLFTSQTPTITDASDGAPGITTATTARFATAGTVSGVRFYATATVSGTYTALLYRVDAADTPSPAGTLLATKTMSGAPAGGTWNTVTFDTPQSVTTSTLYRACIFSGAGRYVATTSFFTVDLVNGDITADANGDDPVGLGSLRNGAFAIDASAIYPSGGGGTCYFVDFEFTATGGDTAITPTGIAAPITLGAPTVAIQGIAPDGIESQMTLGAPTITTPAPAGGWNGLMAVIESARQDARVNAERRRNPLDCPQHGWPLVRVRGVLHCQFGGHVITPTN
jgi:hypothetical protein